MDVSRKDNNKWVKKFTDYKDSEVRGKPLQLGRTCHRRRTLGKTKTAGKAMGNPPGKYMICKTVSMQPHHSVV